MAEYLGYDAAMQRYLFSKADQSGTPLEGTFELTSRCTLDCNMCYIHTPRGDLDKQSREISGDKWLDLAGQARKKGMLFILLTGGEPLLHHDFEKIYVGLKEMGFVIVINSNGTLFNQEKVDWISKNPPSKINISLYGASNETYGEMCGAHKGFDLVSENILRLKRAGVNIRLNLTLTRKNIGDFLKMDEFARENNIQVKFSRYIFPPARRDSAYEMEESYRLSPEELNEYMRLQLVRQYGEETYHKYISNEYKTVKIGMRNKNLQRFGKGMSCRGGLSTFWVTWEGAMSACAMDIGTIAYPFVEGFDDSWKKIQSGRQAIYFPDECLKCELRCICPTCPAAHYAELGGFDEPAPYICDLIKSYYEDIEDYLLSHNMIHEK